MLDVLVNDQFVGNAEKKIAELFRQARAERPVVLFFDEVEALAQATLTYYSSVVRRG